MREIKFRGKDYMNKWRIGDLVQEKWGQGVATMIKKNTRATSVLEDTVGQYTGLHDKNGTEIYEGDIVRIDKEDYKYIVKFYDGCFVGVSIYDEHYEQAKILGNLFTLEIEVIGNIYDNPKLLENKQDKE